MAHGSLVDRVPARAPQLPPSLERQLARARACLRVGDRAAAAAAFGAAAEVLRAAAGARREGAS